MLCDHPDGRHWALLSKGDGTFIDLGNYLSDWCMNGGLTRWADINGDGRSDIICEDKGRYEVMFSYGQGTF